MFAAIFIILTMIFLDVSKIRGFQFRPLSKIAFFSFSAIFLGLMVLGAKHVESPFIEYGQVHTLAYFAFFLIVMPALSYYENTLIMYSVKKNNLK
jgi:ubiquinol-cytochrome c reductase cytochrome b subunit